MRSTSSANLLATLRDSLLLEQASRRIATLSKEQQLRIRELYDAASARAGIASELVDARQHGTAFALLREATALYAMAIAVTHDPSVIDSSDHVDAAAELDALLTRGALPNPPVELEQVRAWLEERDPLAFDRLSHDEALSRRAKLDRLIEYLRQLIEPRTSQELRLVRNLRLFVLGLVGVALLSLGAYKALSPTNIARGKPVTVSSRHPQSKASPEGLTDGSTAGPYGVHTKAEDNAWVMVDLQASRKIGQIKVFNRGDGFYDEGLPFSLELSENGADFTEVDQRKASFSRWKPWIYDAKGQQARYVRIRKVGRGYVALSELEVYGAR